MSPRPRTIGEIYAEKSKDRPGGRSLTAFEIRHQAEQIRESLASAGSRPVSAVTVRSLAALVEDLATIVHTLDTGYLAFKPDRVAAPPTEGEPA